MPPRPLRRLVLLLLASALTGGALPATTAADDTAATAAAVRVQLTPRRSALLSAEVGAKIARLPFAEGQAFQEGEILVAFEDSLPRAQTDRAEAVNTAAEKSLATNRRLLALNSIGQMELELSAAELDKARAELAYARAMLGKYTIRAPFAGRVAALKVHEQEFVPAGQGVLEIIDSGVPQIDCIVPSRWLAGLAPGQRAEVQIEETGRTYAARLERIGARVDPVSQSVKVVAAFEGDTADLVAGMSGTITLSPRHP